MTKRNWAAKIAQSRRDIDTRLHTGAISPAQWHDEISALYADMQKASGYSDGAFAQVWQAGFRQYERESFGWCGKSEF